MIKLVVEFHIIDPSHFVKILQLDQKKILNKARKKEKKLEKITNKNKYENWDFSFIFIKQPFFNYLFTPTDIFTLE